MFINLYANSARLRHCRTPGSLILPQPAHDDQAVAPIGAGAGGEGTKPVALGDLDIRPNEVIVEKLFQVFVKGAFAMEGGVV